MIKTKEQCCKEAAEYAREQTLKEAGRMGVTRRKILRRLNEALDAKITKVFNENGELIYSDPLTDNKTRLEAVKLGLTLHDMLPGDKHRIEGSIKHDLSSMTDQEIEDEIQRLAAKKFKK